MCLRLPSQAMKKSLLANHIKKRGNLVTRSHELRFLALPTIVRLSNAKPTQEYIDFQVNIYQRRRSPLLFLWQWFLKFCENFSSPKENVSKRLSICMSAIQPLARQNAEQYKCIKSRLEKENVFQSAIVFTF